MIEALSLLIVLLMSLIIARVATVALTLTGMSQSAARFQARSALTGAGFTTSESERAVNHPLRRRVIMSLMLIGNTGLVLGASLMVALFLGGENESVTSRWPEMMMLVGGMGLLYLFARSRWVERAMARFIENVLARNTDLARRDFTNLLRLGGDYRVVELAVSEGEWLAGQTLRSLELNREGVVVLGVNREDGSYEGAPSGDTRLEAGDVVLLYGREGNVTELDERRAGVGGHLGHVEAVAREQTKKTTGTEEQDEPDAAGRAADRDAEDDSATS